MKPTSQDPSKPSAPILPRIIITAADDGGLGHFDLIADPYARVAMVLGPLSLDEVGPGDTLRVYMTVKGQPRQIASYVIKSADLPGGGQVSPIFTVEANASEINKEPDGTYPFSYDVLYSNQGSDSSIEPLIVRIKRTIPGSPAKPSDPVNDLLPAPGVQPDPVSENDTSATVTISPWSNMSEGDVVTVHWERLRVTSAPIVAGDVGQPVIVTLTAEQLREVGGMEDLPVAYEIFDVVGNHSGRSPYTFVDVEIEPPDAIAAPRIKEASNGSIDPIKQGTTPFTIQIPVSGRSARAVNPDDVIDALFEGRIPGTGKTHSYRAPSVTAPSPIYNLEIPLPVAEVMPVVGGTARVSYTLVPTDGGPALHSRHLGITIVGVPEPLPAVVIQEDTDGDNVLDPETEVAAGAHVDIDYPNMALDDYITLDLLGRRADGVAVNQRKTRAVSKVGKQTLLVDKDYLASLTNGTLTLKYVADSYDSVVVAGVRKRGLLAKRESSPLNVQIRATGAEPQLPAPQVLHVKDGLLDPATPETSVVVPGSVLIKGDTIDYTWASVVSDDGRLTARTDGADLKFDVEGALIADNRDSEVRVSYTRTRNGTVAQSETLAFRVAEASTELIEDFEGYPENHAFGPLRPLTTTYYSIVTAKDNYGAISGGLILSEKPQPPYLINKYARTTYYGGFSIALWQPANFLEFGLGYPDESQSSSVTIDVYYEGDFPMRTFKGKTHSFVTLSTESGYPPVVLVNIHGIGAAYIAIDNITIR